MFKISEPDYIDRV